jgi:hypothetical protein
VARGAVTAAARATVRLFEATTGPRPATVALRATRTDGRAGAFTAESEELDPADPVVSANATGIDAIAEPTPRATARAPTRPITPAKVMSPTLRRAWISMDGTTVEACTPEPTTIETMRYLLH